MDDRDSTLDGAADPVDGAVPPEAPGAAPPDPGVTALPDAPGTALPDAPGTDHAFDANRATDPHETLPLGASPALTLELDASRASDAVSSDLPGPRVRWGGILWGLVLAGLAAWGVFLTATASVEQVGDWVQGVQPLPLAAGAILAVGGLVLVAGLVGLARRAQKRLAARRATA